MGLINRMADNIRKGMRRFLNIAPAASTTLTVSEGEDFLTVCAKNRVWYGGKAFQLSELYRQLENIPDTMFWKAPMTLGQEIRKIHTGLPALTVDVMTHIVKTDFNGAEISCKSTKVPDERWQSIQKSNNFDELLESFLTDIGVVGDGAFKISYDSEISDKPIIEWYPAERIKFTRRRGRIREITFFTDIYDRDRRYQFAEIYGYGYIKYELYTDSGRQVPLTALAQTSWAQGEDVAFDKSLIWAVPAIFGKSSTHKGRGKGLIEPKEGAYDAFDEVFSQWMDALRAGRTKQYIPQSMIPYDPKTARPMRPNAFDNRFIMIGDDPSEHGSGNRVYTESPDIKSDSYLAAYITALDLCLQGVISPSTLGIDTKKLDNAEAQREKEKTTLYTRSRYIDLMEKTISELIITALNVDRVIHDEPLFGEDIEVKLKFGEYANPSFESQVETIGKARSAGTMSVEAGVEEMYGDSKSEEWKSEEVRRIKAEQGIAEEPQRSELDDIEL